jgi:hypothetical protein
MEIFRYWRWQLQAERPTIEHVEHRPVEQHAIDFIDGFFVPRSLTPVLPESRDPQGDDLTPNGYSKD